MTWLQGGGEREFNGLGDVYRKTIASDGVAGLYRGFTISCVGIIVYRGLYFGMYDSLKPVLLTGDLADNFLASFGLGWAITIAAGACERACMHARPCMPVRGWLAVDAWARAVRL